MCTFVGACPHINELFAKHIALRYVKFSVSGVKFRALYNENSVSAHYSC